MASLNKSINALRNSHNRIIIISASESVFMCQSINPPDLWSVIALMCCFFDSSTSLSLLLTFPRRPFRSVSSPGSAHGVSGCEKQPQHLGAVGPALLCQHWQRVRCLFRKEKTTACQAVALQVRITTSALSHMPSCRSRYCQNWKERSLKCRYLKRAKLDFKLNRSI